MNAAQALSASKENVAKVLVLSIDNELNQVQEAIQGAVNLGQMDMNILFYKSRRQVIELVAEYLKKEGYKVSVRGQDGSPLALYVNWKKA